MDLAVVMPQEVLADKREDGRVRGIRAHGTHPPNGSVAGTPSTRKSARLGPPGPGGPERDGLARPVRQPAGRPTEEV